MAAVGMYMSVVVSVVFGWILLLAVTFQLPSTQVAIDSTRRRRTSCPSSWDESMGQNWAEILLFICVVAQFFCLTASVTSASRMMFAFSRDRAVPGPQLWRSVRRTASQMVGVRRSGSSPAVADDPGQLELLHRLRRWNLDRGDRLVHRFHPPRHAALAAGDAWDEPSAWSLGSHYKWLDPIAIVWVAIISILFIFPLYDVGMPCSDGFSWEFTNYTILWFAGIGLVFGGWWVLSATQVVHGAGADGHRGGARAARRGAARASSTFRRRPAPSA